MANGVLTTDELLAATGYKRAGDLENHLTRIGVRFLPGKDGPWTTIDALNRALGILPGGEQDLYGADSV